MRPLFAAILRDARPRRAPQDEAEYIAAWLARPRTAGPGAATNQCRLFDAWGFHAPFDSDARVGRSRAVGGAGLPANHPAPPGRPQYDREQIGDGYDSFGPRVPRPRH